MTTTCTQLRVSHAYGREQRSIVGSVIINTNSCPLYRYVGYNIYVKDNDVAQRL